MEFTEDFGSGNLIRHFDGTTAELFIPEGTPVSLTESFIISPNTFNPHWKLPTLSQLLPEHLTPILELAPALFILGTGPTFTIVEDEQLAPVFEAKIPVEVMDSAAACRTYNVLMSEERDVAAGIIF